MRVPEYIAPVAKKALKMPVFLLFYRHYMDAARGAGTGSYPLSASDLRKKIYVPVCIIMCEETFCHGP